MTRLPRLSRDQIRALAAPAVIAAACAVCLLANLPGHLSYDSVLQLSQGRSGVYNNWHPPIMAWMLGLGDAVVRGPGLFTALDILLLYGALLALALLEPRGSWPGVIVALALALTPDWLIYPGVVWKDVLFAAASAAGFAALAHAAAHWGERRLRLGLIALAILLLAVAALARQNGVAVLAVGLLTLAVIAARSSPAAPLKAAAAHGGVALLGAAALMGAVTAGLQTRSDGEPSRIYQLEDLQTYDLAAALRADPNLRLDRLHRVAPELERLIRTEGAAAYTPVRIDPIAGLPDLQKALFDTPPETMTRQWRDLMVQHPLTYLKVRLTAFAWVLFTPDIDTCVAVYVGADGPSAVMAELGMPTRMDARDEALKAYGEGLMHTPLFSHAFYALIGAAALVVLARRRRPADLAVAGMLLGAAAFTATFFVISVACDYRYLYFPDVAAMAAALYLAAGWRPNWPQRMKSPAPSA